MARHDPADAAAKTHPGVRDYASRLEVDALRGARIGIRRDYSGAGNMGVQEIFEEVVETLGEMGATVVDPVDLEIPESVFDAEYEVLLYEFKADLNAYLAAGVIDPAVDTLAKIIEFNQLNVDRVMPWFGQEIFLLAESKGSLDDPAYSRALEESHVAVSRLIDEIMQENDLDAIIAPTNGPTWTTDLVNGDQWGSESVSSSSAAAVSGYPAVTIPMGEIHGLPIGLSFLGLPLTESELLGFAYALEQRLGAWEAPSLRPNVEIPAD